MGDEKLSRDDLFLLMESYKNTIELNTTLSHQQNSIIDQQNLILEQDRKTYEKMDLLIVKLGEHTQALKDIQTEMTTSNANRRLECTKEHSSISTKVYGLIGSLVVIVIALVTLLNHTYKYSDILDAIAKAVGVK